MGDERPEPLVITGHLRQILTINAAAAASCLLDEAAKDKVLGYTGRRYMLVCEGLYQTKIIPQFILQRLRTVPYNR